MEVECGEYAELEHASTPQGLWGNDEWLRQTPRMWRFDVAQSILDHR